MQSQRKGGMGAGGKVAVAVGWSRCPCCASLGEAAYGESGQVALTASLGGTCLSAQKNLSPLLRKAPLRKRRGDDRRTGVRLSAPAEPDVFRRVREMREGGQNPHLCYKVQLPEIFPNKLATLQYAMYLSLAAFPRRLERLLIDHGAAEALAIVSLD